MSPPRTGALSVPQPVGVLLSRALGDLLSNATQHTAEVGIDLSVTGETLRLDVADNGPGLDPAVIDDPATSLHSLRADARKLGGDLASLDGPGAHLRLTASLATCATWRRTSGTR